MLTKIQIKNYGSNKKINIELDPHITVITGKSFIGKSWILRALRWVIRNKPAGTSFINWDTDKARVRLFADGHKIIRVRSKSTNTYKLNKKPFVAFGNDVPKDIIELLNMSDINFQGVNVLGQHEPPFWFCETAGEVSRRLNFIINLQIIDSTLANIASYRLTTQAEITVTENRLAKFIETRKSLAYIKRLNTDLERVEDLQSKHMRIAQSASLLGELLKSAESHQRIREALGEVTREGKIALSKGKKLRGIRDSVRELTELYSTGKDLNSILEARPPSLTPLENLKKQMMEITEQCNELNDLLESAEEYKEKGCQAKTELNLLMGKLKEIAGGRCPLCGKKMS